MKQEDSSKVKKVDYGNGVIKWYRDGKLHREDGPAIVEPDRGRQWYRDGRLHREDGPAIIWNSGTREYYVDGKFIKKEPGKPPHLEENWPSAIARRTLVELLERTSSQLRSEWRDLDSYDCSGDELKALSFIYFEAAKDISRMYIPEDMTIEAFKQELIELIRASGSDWGYGDQSHLRSKVRSAVYEFLREVSQ